MKNTMKKNVIKDNRTDRIYFDNGMIRMFETVLIENISLEEAKKQYPNIIEV